MFVCVCVRACVHCCTSSFPSEFIAFMVHPCKLGAVGSHHAPMGTLTHSSGYTEWARIINDHENSRNSSGIRKNIPVLQPLDHMLNACKCLFIDSFFTIFIFYSFVFPCFYFNYFIFLFHFIFYYFFIFILFYLLLLFSFLLYSVT